MNKNQFRIIFNRARGLLMAVAEHVKSHSNVGSADPSSNRKKTDVESSTYIATVKPLVFSILLSCGMVGVVFDVTNAHAGGVIADPNSSVNQRPMVTEAANGVPLVNIQTPSAAGVSRNTYSQFDVHGQGVILNNSRTNVQTQLGGYVQGNPYLAAGTARVILNEVNSSNPSLLNGYVEVAGSRAQVVIANPAGISCDGCGFINASRITLTTGTPILNSGNLLGYRVTGGEINFFGSGLDSSQANYTDIIARAVHVNVGVFANDLKVITGSNQVNVAANGDISGITPIAGSGSMPLVALDVAALGGMYAGKIHLIGTEAGLGVSNAGEIGASTGNVTIDVNGMITNAASGRIISQQDAQINTTHHIDNAGVIYSGAAATLTATGSVTNANIIASLGNTTINAGSVNSNANSILAAGLNADGSLPGAGSLTVNADQSIIAQGQNIAAKDQAFNALSIDLTGSQTVGQSLTFNAGNGNLNAANSVISAAGDLTVSVSQSLIADGAAIRANQFNFAAYDVSNVGGELVQTGSGDTSISLIGNLNNNQGRIASNTSSLTLNAQTISNVDGSIEHAGVGAFNIGADTYNGTHGTVITNGNLNLTANTAVLDSGTTVASKIDLDTVSLSNRSGEIIQSGIGSSNIRASQSFDNTGGYIASNGSLSVNAGDLINQSGRIQTANASNLHISVTGLVDNSSGQISAGSSLDINADELLNDAGEITSKQTLATTIAQSLDNNQGLIAANQEVTITAGAINNSQGIMASINAGFTAFANDDINNEQGSLQAAQDLHLTSTGFNNTDGTLSGSNINLDSQFEAIDNTSGIIAAIGTLTVNSGQLTNDTGLIQATSDILIDTNGQTFSNNNSGSTNGILSEGSITLTTGDLNNQSGFIGANGNITANSSAISNIQTGSIVSESDISIIGASVDNRGGRIEATENLTLSIDDSLINSANNSSASLLRAGQSLSISTNSIANNDTLPEVGGSAQGIEGHNVLVAANTLNNSSGAIRANNSLTITSHGSANNTQGLISSRNTLKITDSDLTSRALTITNTLGTVIADNDVRIDSSGLTGDGKILSEGDLTVSITGSYNQTRGSEMQANGNLSLSATGTVTNQSKILAGKTLDINAANLSNASSGEISGFDTQLIVTGTLTNRGLIDGQDTFIDAVTLANIGTGSIFGDHVAIVVNTLINQDETISSVAHAAVIAARDQLDIGAQTVSNLNNSLLFSGGDMAIGGSLDVNKNATVANGDPQVAMLINRNGTIEALGNLVINAADIQNTNAGLTTQLVVDSTRLIQEVQPEGWSRRYDVSRFPTIFNYGIEGQYFIYDDGIARPAFEDYSFFNYTETIKSTQVLTSKPGQLLSGGNMTIIGDVTNVDSKIIAGGDLDITGGTLNNQNSEGQIVKSYSGWVQFRDWDGDDEELEFGRQNPFNPASSTTTFPLSTTEVLQATTPVGTRTQIDAHATSNVSQSATSAGSADVQVNPIGTTPAITTVVATNTVDGQTVDSLVGTAIPNTTISNSSLFQANPDPTSSYFIETNPRFANYKTWLSSDYMLNQLSYDPATTTKRLGDGFYEQKLIREQISSLTGKRFLEGYASDEAQYQALMLNGVTFAKEFNLTPGIALTDLQMAQLTSDIVWLVKKTITLPDGTTIQALVPQVYAMLREGDLTDTGSLLAGNSVNINLTDDLNNGGTIGSRNLMVLTADNITNLGGRINANDLSINAGRDIDNIGGVISAQNSMVLNAERDINVISTTQSAENAFGKSVFTRTNLDRVAGLYVTGGQGLMVASAGNNIHLDAAQLVNAAADGVGNLTLLKAGNNLTLGTVEIAEQNNSTETSKRFNKSGSTQEVGTQIQTQGDITFVANNDLNITAARITSQSGGLQGLAGGNISIEEGRATNNSSVGQHKKDSGTFSSKTKTQIDSFESDTSIGSVLSAESITLVAGAKIAEEGSVTTQQGSGNLTIQGSSVVATNDVRLNAGGDININASQDKFDESHYSKVKQSGLSSSGASVTFGNSKLTNTTDSQQVVNVASTLGSISGDVNINSGSTYTQTGSDLLAPEGNVDITAKQVNITTATDTYDTQQTMKYKQSGITLAVSSSALNLAQNVANSTQGSIESDSTKNKMLNALQTYANASTLMEQKDAIVGAVKAGDAQGVADAAGVRVSISIGSSKASSTNTTNATVSQESLLKAGGDINIKVTQENINVVGSKIIAAQNITLDAVKDINLIAGADTDTNQSKNKSSSNSVGVSFGIGENTGFSVDVAASRGKGNANSDSTIYTNTQVKAGETLKLKSGEDTNLIGANITGKQVTANIGHDLNLQSLQDIATSKAKQKNTGVSISVPIGTGTGRGSINQSKQESRSNYASVYEQTSINAGSEGFHIITKGNTDLNGSTITSEASPDKNLLITSTLTTSNIQNHMDAKSTSSTTGLSTDMLNSKYAALKGAASNLMNNGKASVSDDSTTLSAIAPARIVITNQEVQQQLTGQTAEQTINGLNRDTSNTNRVLEKPDVVALQNEVQQQQADNILLLTTATAFTDEAFRKMFISNATVNVLVRNPDGSIKHGEDGKPLFRQLTLEEKMNLQPSADGKIYIANNGINNTIEAAAKYAEQHSNANGEQYFIYFPIANNDISELLIAGYQNFLENGTTGLTNATQENVNMMQQYGATGLHIDGHSRGGLTTGNALEYLNSQGNVGTLYNTTIHLFGSAYNALQADNLLSNLQGRDMVTDATQTNNMVIQQQTHFLDFVGYLLGNNPNTGGSIPKGSSFIKETTRIMGGKNTVHSCYGNGGDDCSALWNGSLPVLTPVRTYSNK